MMYLVLTAMLALNVAAETLQAFRIVDESLMKTYLSFSDKNRSLISDFRTQYDINPNKVEKWLKEANKVHKMSDSLVSYIVDLKEKLALAADAKVKAPEEPMDDENALIITNSNDSLVLKRQDDLNVSPELMLTKHRGDELKGKIIEYRDSLIEIVKDYPSIIENLNSSLDVKDPKSVGKLEKERRTWAQQNFEASPVIASITLLSKMQIDVRNAESAVLRHLYNQIDAKSLKFTGLQAKVIPDASHVFQGQEYKARIFLSAEDSTQKLKVFVNGNTNPLKTEGNEAIYSFIPTEPGVFKYKGQIKYKSPDGEDIYKDFEQEYKVLKPEVTISPTKMFVFYKGLKNPIDVAVPLVDQENIEPECTNGKLSKVGNSWIVEPTELDYTGDRTRVIIYANINGKKTLMGEEKFRVKKVPDPKATVAGKATGKINQAVLPTLNFVNATLEDFDFDLTFVVTGFDVTVMKSGFVNTLHSNNYNFTNDQKILLTSLRVGDKFVIENITAKIQGKPDDQDRILNSITLQVE